MLDVLFLAAALQVGAAAAGTAGGQYRRNSTSGTQVHGCTFSTPSGTQQSAYLAASERVIDPGLAQLMRKLDDLRSVMDDDAPNNGAIYWARNAIEIGYKVCLTPTNILRSAEGGIGLCFLSPDRYASIEFLNSGEIIGLTNIDGAPEPQIWDIDPENMTDELNAIHNFMCQRQ
jgi:hypothetical protein